MDKNNLVGEMERKNLIKRIAISIVIGCLLLAMIYFLSNKSEPEIDYIWRSDDTIYVQWRHGNIVWVEEIKTLTSKEQEKLNKQLNGDTKTIIE